MNRTTSDLKLQLIRGVTAFPTLATLIALEKTLGMVFKTRLTTVVEWRRFAQ